MPRTTPDQAPARYAQWLDEVKRGSEFSTYDDYEQFIAVLARRNPRTPPERLEFIARSWARAGADGRIELWADPSTSMSIPCCTSAIRRKPAGARSSAPLLFVPADESELAKRMAGEIGEAALARSCSRTSRLRRSRGAGHMMHHERPEESRRAARGGSSPTAVARNRPSFLPTAYESTAWLQPIRKQAAGEFLERSAPGRLRQRLAASARASPAQSRSNSPSMPFARSRCPRRRR